MMISRINVQAARPRMTSPATYKTRVFFFHDKESVANDLVNRYNRPHKLYRQLLPSVLARAGIDPNMKARWSQKAGCNCGCSPGFILENHHGKDIFVHVLP